jgi:hypothetical protein
LPQVRHDKTVPIDGGAATYLCFALIYHANWCPLTCSFSLGKETKSRRRQVGAIWPSDSRRWIQSIESVQLFQHLSAFEHFHVEGDVRLENEVFVVLRYDFLAFDNTSQI